MPSLNSRHRQFPLYAERLCAEWESIDFIERDALVYHFYDLCLLVTLARTFTERSGV